MLAQGRWSPLSITELSVTTLYDTLKHPSKCGNDRLYDGDECLAPVAHESGCVDVGLLMVEGDPVEQGHVVLHEVAPYLYFICSEICELEDLKQDGQ